MPKSKKVVYEIVCCNNPEHVFSKAFEIKPGTEETLSEAEAYCPQCDDYVRVVIRGELPRNKDVLRKFNIE
ncbi:MAG: hypothetical protein KJ645_12690 [Planctomycetes bacterium]|nr:hypothetical protein [Planctomycetota bacterium]